MYQACKLVRSSDIVWPNFTFSPTKSVMYRHVIDWFMLVNVQSQKVDFYHVFITQMKAMYMALSHLLLLHYKNISHNSYSL
jgi:hypothetical protein